MPRRLALVRTVVAAGCIGSMVRGGESAGVPAVMFSFIASPLKKGSVYRAFNYLVAATYTYQVLSAWGPRSSPANSSASHVSNYLLSII